MARGKKKEENLTLEEKLKQALVPEEEWPYEVPGNWCWVKLGYVCNIENGYAFKSDFFSNESGFPVVRISNIVDNEINLEKCVYSTEADISDRFIVQYGDLLIAMSGATTGKNGLYLLNQTAYLNQRVGNIKIMNHELLYEEYRNYYIRYIEQNILNSAYGGAQPNISSEKLGALQIPLPPVQEQQRITNYIKELFYKLDEIKEKVQCVLESSEDRKAAIFQKAFSGELTKQWREKNGIGKESWKKLKFYEVAQIKSNLVEPKEYMEYPHIAPDNIEKRSGKLLQYNTIAEDKVFSSKHRFFSGQILYSKIRPYLSKVVLVDFEGLCSADMYPIEAKENVKYLWYYMLSDDFLEQASSAGSRTVLPKINQKELSNLDVCIPSEMEQDEIVKILDKSFPLQESTKRKCERVVTQLDVLKKSILSRAFRGELGTNNPDEESAIELLKTIL